MDGRKKRKFLIGGGVAVEGCLWGRVEQELLAQTLGEHFNGTTLLRGALAREEKTQVTLACGSAVISPLDH